MDCYTSGRQSNANTWLHTAPLSVRIQDQAYTQHVPAGYGLVISQSLPTTATPGGLERSKNMDKELNELTDLVDDLLIKLDEINKKLEQAVRETQEQLDEIVGPSA